MVRPPPPAPPAFEVGDTAEWQTSLFTHTATDDPIDSPLTALPAAALPFSARVPPGEVFRHTFTAPGRHAYVCMPHEDLEMHGTIDVTP